MKCPKCNTELRYSKVDSSCYLCPVAAIERIAELEAACKLYREASIQSHSGHWDREMTHGLNCPVCQRARELRKEADAILGGEK